MSALFHYTARSSEGAFVAGSFRAESADQALAHLRNRPLFVTSLHPAASGKGALISLATILPIRSTVRVAFFRSLATMTAAGVPMHRALEVTIAGCSHARFRETLQSIAADVASGVALSVAMDRRPREFSKLFVALIRAGETGGTIDEALDRLAAFLERDTEVRRRLAASLAYPAIVTACAIALIVFLVASIVPSFAAIFAEMRVSLPISTRALIFLGRELQSPVVWCGSIAVAFAGCIGAQLLRRVEVIGDAIDGLALRLPLIGSIFRKAMSARFARTLGTLLRAGVPLMTALNACEDVVGNRRYSACARAIGAALSAGSPVAVPIEESRLFDALFVQLVQVGEETGSLDAMLLRLARYIEEDLEAALATLGNVLEPALILVLGSAVGTIVGSILIPLYSMIGSIK